jgi:branched-chain amino acid aminotransferase
MIYLNGVIIDQSKASVNIEDGGFLQGDGLFETMRAYNGRIFALEAHIDRLVKSAAVVLMDNLPTRDALADACRKIVEVNRLKNARVRLTVTRGVSGQSQATVLASATEYRVCNDAELKEGFSVITLRGYRFSNDKFARIKSTAYQRSAIARKNAEQAGCDEAVLVNEAGNICEGSYTNIFAVDGRRIITPPLIDGLLPGITRAIVIRLAKENGFEVAERSIPLDAFYGMSEVFATNSLIEIVPVFEIDGIKIGSGVKSTAHTLLDLYKTAVKSSSGIS